MRTRLAESLKEKFTFQMMMFSSFNNSSCRVLKGTRATTTKKRVTVNRKSVWEGKHKKVKPDTAVSSRTVEYMRNEIKECSSV